MAANHRVLIAYASWEISEHYEKMLSSGEFKNDITNI